ncbi:sugar ABC transporter ATP-binding protein [Streptomyces sp. ISL-36]|uniref:ATP-binding cassette domain-containing protein n=1 Tax=Streptomyces sp. ISL-36 TaxID=2819182 RepID=UPI001BE9A098|nr:ATP-binding cassette domain-containing protein [Streptomyces sp. ISL-36]MBT2442723.1 sugar ABC transporter ATP-binding protein [Streptomyces sp. ISL-36]
MERVSDAPVLELSGVSKRFGAVHALTDVSLEIRSGEVVALVGESGAGKSALVKVIAGVEPADSGTVRWQGHAARIARPHDSRRLGIAAVYQDLGLCGNLDVVGNIFLGRELGTVFAVDEVEMGRRTRALLQRLSIDLPDLRAPVASLSGSQRQMVAVARALLSDPVLLMLDEPTAALGVAQSHRFLDMVEELREQGLALLLISRNLGDVKAVADQVAVLRHGRNNGFFSVHDTSEEQIIASMTGATDNAVTQRGVDDVEEGLA